MFCILLSLFYLYCVHIALLYSNVRLSHNKRLLTYFSLQLNSLIYSFLLLIIYIHCYLDNNLDGMEWRFVLMCH